MRASSLVFTHSNLPYSTCSQLLKTNEQPISETTARKQMYQRLMQCFPDGWMTTYDMSRQYSQYKVRQQKKEDKTASITSH
ncbi:hypothetical protein BC943DRAFT_331238 [Umbelopsis sp. AD052]|nr:hypothetical protein BC943DRAFT_331238 [Umbelopsis sp. AD052]